MKKGQPVQIRWILFLFGIFGNLMVGGQSWAFNQPPMNHSITTFLDGGAPQGFYYMNYSILTKGKTPMDQDGNEVPGGAKVNALVSSHQFLLYQHCKIFRRESRSGRYLEPERRDVERSASRATASASRKFFPCDLQHGGDGGYDYWSRARLERRHPFGRAFFSTI